METSRTQSWQVGTVKITRVVEMEVAVVQNSSCQMPLGTLVKPLTGCNHTSWTPMAISS